MPNELPARDSMLKAWVDKRSDAWHDGYDEGMAILSEWGFKTYPDTPDDRYLHYLYLQGVAQAITNKAREVGDLNLPRVSDDPQNKRRAPR